MLSFFTVICSCIMIHFSYGLYQNYQLKKQYDLSDDREITLTLQGNFDEISDGELNNDESFFAEADSADRYVTVDLLKKYVAEFSNTYTDNLKYVEATAIVDRLPFRMDFAIRDGRMVKSDEFEKEIEDNALLESGRYFTEEEYRNGEAVALCWDYLHWNTMSSPVSRRMAVDRNTLRIQGKEYKIIAYGIIDVDRPTIPVTSLEGATPFAGEIVFHFRRPIRQEQYDVVAEKTAKVLNDKAVIKPVSLPNDDAVYLYNTIILVTVFITLVSAMNFAILYRYILSCRKQSLMVYRICGLSIGKVVLLYLGECVAMTVPAYVIGVLLFANVILKKMSGYYEYMNDSYGISVYLIFFLVYFLLSLLILTVMIIHALKTDMDLKVEGGIQ